MGVNKKVIAKITEVLAHTDIFLGITSEAFFDADCSCRRELDWFQNAAKESKIGLFPGERCRIVHARKEYIPAAQWPPALQGIVGYEFFTKTNDYPKGLPLTPGTPEYEAKISGLAEGILLTLDAIQEIRDKKQIKILSLTASPDSDVFYELAQETIVKSFSHINAQDLFIDMPDPVEATLTEIELRCRDTTFDILILFCHGSKEGFLMFEDRMGNKIPVPGEEVARVIAGLDHQPYVIILAACHSAGPGEKAELTLLESPGQALFDGTSIPCIIGMKSEISHHAAIDFNRGFIQGLLKNKSFQQAFNQGIKSIQEGEIIRLQDKTMKWRYSREAEIPVLFSRQINTALTRKDFHDTFLSQPTIESTDFETASYLKRGFVGRRKELRDVFHIMDEEKPGSILVKGPGGIGKSTFMTRICAKYIEEGYKLVVFVGLVQVHSVMKKLVQKTADPGYAEAFAQRQAHFWEEVFFDLMRDILFPQKVIIFFDNFEDNQEIETGAIPDPEVQRFISLCATHLTGKDSILFITGRYMVPANVRHIINLPPLTSMENRKLFMFKQTLKDLKARHIREVYTKIGGNPRAVEVLEVLSREAFRKQGLGDLTDTEEKQALFGRVIGDVQSILTGTTKVAAFEFPPQYLETLIRTLSPEELTFLKGISLYQTPVTEGAPGIPGQDVCYSARKKLINLSLIMFVPYNKYYTYRLVSEYVISHLYEKDELKTLRIQAAIYLEESGNYVEALYQYKEAEEWDRAYNVADPLQNWLSDHGHVYNARGIMEGINPVLLDKEHQAQWYHAYGLIEQRQGNVENALTCYEKALTIDEELGNKAGIATSYHQIGMIHQDKGEYDRAIDFYTKSLHIQEELGNKAGIADTIHQIGMINQNKGEYDRAIDFYTKSLHIKEELGNKAGIASSYHQLGNIHCLKGEYDQASDYYNRSLINEEELGNKAGIAVSYHQIGMIYQYKGAYDQAIDFYTKSLHIKEELGNKAGIADSYHQIGMIHQQKGEYDRAIGFYTKSLLIKEELGNKAGIADSYNQIGIIHQNMGEYEKATDFYTKSLHINEELGNKAGIASSYHNIGAIHQYKGEYNKAIGFYTKSLHINEELGNKSGIASSYHQIGMIHQDKGEYDRAIDFYTKSLHIQEELGNKAGIAGSYHQIGRIHQDKGEYDRAIDFYTKSLHIQEELGNKAGIAGSYHQIGMIHQHKGEYDRAIDFYTKSLHIKEELGNKAGMATSYGQMGRICQVEEKFNEALDYFIRAYCLFRVLQHPYQGTVGAWLLQLQPHIPGDVYEQKLRKAGISVEELGQAEGGAGNVVDLLRHFTRLVLTGDDKAPEEIDAFIGQVPNEAKGDEQWQGIAGYLGFLKELAAAEDKEGFLAGVDAEMVGLMRQLLGEDADNENSSPKETDNVTHMLKVLTKSALAENSRIAEQIDVFIKQIPMELKEDKQWQILSRYLGFLKDLSAVEDKKAFLTGANKEMTNIVQVILNNNEEFQI